MRAGSCAPPRWDSCSPRRRCSRCGAQGEPVPPRWFEMDGTEHAARHASARPPAKSRIAAHTAAHAENPQVTHLDRIEWETRVRDFGDYSYRQTWVYGQKLANKRGAVSE